MCPVFKNVDPWKVSNPAGRQKWPLIYEHKMSRLEKLRVHTVLWPTGVKCTHNTSETLRAGPVTHLRLYSHNGAETLFIATAFPIFYGYLSFVNIFRWSQNWIPPSDSWIQSKSSHTLFNFDPSWKVFFHLCLSLQSCLSLQDPWPKVNVAAMTGQDLRMCHLNTTSARGNTGALVYITEGLFTN